MDVELGVGAPAGGWTTEALFRRHVGDVTRIVARLLGPGAGEDDVDDITQQVFIAADRSLHRFRGDAKVTTWLYGIASRTVLHNLRGRRRYRQMIERFEEHVARADADVHKRIEDREALSLVWGALLRVPPKRRVVFVLYEIEGMTSPEVAEILDVSEATVRTRLRRARGQVMTLVEKAGLTK